MSNLKKLTDSDEKERIIGENIAKARKRRGLTGQELAKGTGLTLSYLSRIENGKQSPGLGFLRKVSEYLEIDLATLLFSKEEKDTLKALCSSREVRELVNAYNDLAPEDKDMLRIFLDSLSTSRRKSRRVISRLASVHRAAQ